MKYKLEYSQIVRRKLKSLKLYLSEQYGEDFAKSAVKKITDRARVLQDNPDIGVDMAAKYEIDTDYRELYVNHNHLFYYKDKSHFNLNYLYTNGNIVIMAVNSNSVIKSFDIFENKAISLPVIHDTESV